MLQMFNINIIFYRTINTQKIIIQNWIIINIKKVYIEKKLSHSCQVM